VSRPARPPTCAATVGSSGAGHVRRGYTADDVVNRPIGILRDADEAVGRDHAPSRVRPWLAMLRESLFTPAGTAAFQRRAAGRRAA
jgi:hypothetical protein